MINILKEAYTMMTILMIDVEGGKESLIKQLYQQLKEVKKSKKHTEIDILYLARCYTHSDISLMIDVKNPEALPDFITDVILPLDGAWDIQMIPLLNPNFFEVPKFIKKKKYNHFTITLDVKSKQTKSVFKKLKKIAATDEIAITFLAYTFFSYENDIILTLLSPDMSSAGKFVKNKLRTIDGVIDTLLWQMDTWKSIITENEWKEYINQFLEKDLIDIALDKWEMDDYICCC
jgi:DNA-binding Lrp family transcriptional regulator